jgi:N-acetylmuramic acid 6-phosphate (MurNAc-6-P) etherase
MIEFSDNCAFVGAIVITLSSTGSTPYCVGTTTIALDSIGAITTALDYSRFRRVHRLIITPTFVGAALDIPSYVGT